MRGISAAAAAEYRAHDEEDCRECVVDFKGRYVCEERLHRVCGFQRKECVRGISAAAAAEYRVHDEEDCGEFIGFKGRGS